MSLPHLLCVDDSEAILAFESAALAGHYACSVATNGREALEKVAQLRPAAMLLDLSMPQMDGDEVLARMQQDPQLKTVPVIIVSSEKERGEKCVKNGAAAFLEKPIRADVLLSMVARVLDEARNRERQGSMAVLFVEVGTAKLGLPLEGVVGVVDQPATRVVPNAPEYLSEYFELHGDPVFVLDLARRLGVSYREPVLERKLVVIGHEVNRQQVLIALRVDRVRDPGEFSAAEITPRDKLLGPRVDEKLMLLRALVRTEEGHLPVLDTKTLLDPTMLAHLPALIGAGALLPPEVR
ncbi:MAG TPA: response regulator [Myxococcaceae bacterium]|nr:response regulator [Myxococcaceae bacterium]